MGRVIIYWQMKQNRHRQWSEKNIPGIKIIGYFYPGCAKKYFANKEQPNENNVRTKQKLLRNLDQDKLRPSGHLANAELLKNSHINCLSKKTEKIV